MYKILKISLSVLHIVPKYISDFWNSWKLLYLVYKNVDSVEKILPVLENVEITLSSF
jgi:hypothetical protein